MRTALVIALLLAGCAEQAEPPATMTPVASATPAVALTPTPATATSVTTTPGSTPTPTTTPTPTATPASTPTPAATPSPTPTPTAGAVTINIQDFAFIGPSTVPVGTTVTWKNLDGAPHTATANDGSFDTGTLAQQQAKSHTFASAGTFGYRCAIHPSMTASLTVTA